MGNKTVTWGDTFDAWRQVDPGHAALLACLIKTEIIPPIDSEDRGFPHDQWDEYDEWLALWVDAARAHWMRSGRSAETFDPEELYREQEFQRRISSGELSNNDLDELMMRKTDCYLQRGYYVENRT